MMPPPLRTLVLRLLLLVALGAVPAGAGGPVVVVDDTTFDDADWVLVDISMEPSECLILRDVPSGARICGQGDSDSSDGDMRAHTGLIEIKGDGVVTTDLTVGSHVEGHLAYDPSSSGEIVSLDAAFKLKQTVPTDGIDSTFYGHLLIEQGGSFYISQARIAVTSMNGNPSAFQQFLVTGLGAAGFDRITTGGLVPGSNPDFSASGAPIHFGWAIDMSWDGELPDRVFTLDFLNRGFFLDEFGASVVAAPPAVPSLGPGWAPLVAAVVLGAAWWRRRAGPKDGRWAKVE